jgi:hypothetical protein
MSLTEEATRLRSSSPLGCLLKPSERAALYALLGKNSPPQTLSMTNIHDGDCAFGDQVS